jgi:predicted Zn-dependent protease
MIWNKTPNTLDTRNRPNALDALDVLLRLTLAVVLVVVTTVTPVLASAPQEKKIDKDDADIENIGNRDINDGTFSNWNFTSLEKEIALGRELAAEIERQVRLVDDPVISEYVNRVGQNIVRNSDAQVPFTFKVVEDDSINAFALPGGFVFVNTGILLRADEEAEVAGVLAHEIAHVTARHGTENSTKNQLINLASIPLIFLGGVVGFGIRQAAGLIIPMQYMSFSRGAEEEADYLGIQYAYKTGYDPGAAVTFFEKIQALETAKPGTISSLFASHPPTENRIEKTQENIGLVLPERDRYVLTTSEFMDVKERLVIYLNRPEAEEEEDNRPSLRRRTPRPDRGSDDAEEEVYERPEEEAPPRMERRDDDPDRVPADDDRPILRRSGGQ